MKTRILVLFLLFFFTSSQAQTFEVIGRDTMNMMDRKGNKKGKWAVRAAGYNRQIIETGMYRNNRKEGEWIEYYKNGKMRNKLTYANGVLEGPAAFYNTDGKVLKEGKFKGNKWVQ